MTDAFVDEFAARHVERSLSESADKDKVEAWTNGERTRQEAEELIAYLLAEAQKKLSERNG